MASSPTVKPPAATAASVGAHAAKSADRRLRLDDILKFMVMDGLVPGPDAEHLGRSRTKQFEHPLELIAAQKWRSAKPPHKLMTLEFLVEWLAGRLKVPYTTSIR
jgi:general secretion pathway protein E